MSERFSCKYMNIKGEILTASPHTSEYIIKINFYHFLFDFQSLLSLNKFHVKKYIKLFYFLFLYLYFIKRSPSRYFSVHHKLLFVFVGRRYGCISIDFSFLIKNLLCTMEKFELSINQHLCEIGRTLFHFHQNFNHIII